VTNGGFNGFPSGGSGAVADGSIGPGKLAAPMAPGVLASGYYYSTTSSLSTSSTLGVGTLRLAPWFVPNACRISRIGAEVTSGGDSGSKLRLCLYADSGAGLPSTLLLDAGTIAGDSATVQEITINQQLSAGLYWIGASVQVVTVTQPTVRTGTIACWTSPWLGTSAPGAGTISAGVTYGSVTAAAPGVLAPGSISTAGAVPRIFVKVA
jgi:hypothetical protein